MTADPERQELADLVNPFVGTAEDEPDFGTGGGAGNTFPGAVAPFGLVQLSPDTHPGDRNVAGGYAWSDERIRGFSPTHFSGAGCAAFQDAPILPTTAPPDAPIHRVRVDPQRLPRFSHDHESAAAGRYRVTLDPGTDRAIEVEAAAALRSGALGLRFPDAGTPTLVVDASGSATGTIAASIEIDAEAREVAVSATSGRFCYQRNVYTVHVVYRFDRPVTAHGTWVGDDLRPDTASADASAAGRFGFETVPGRPPKIHGGPEAGVHVGGWVCLDPGRDRTVEVQVGVSFVSRDGARANLDAGPGDLEATAAAAVSAWNDLLGRVEVSGGSRADHRMLATALYHAFLHPNVHSDADGRYRGFDGEVHDAGDRPVLANVSGWDIYRTQIPLLAMLAPERAGDLAGSLLAAHQHSGWLPKWSLAAAHTDVMVGDPADPILAAIDAFGAAGTADPDALLDAMVAGATTYGRTVTDRWDYVQRQALLAYERFGYVPAEEDRHGLGPIATLTDASLVWGSAATTLEYQIADFAIAAMAQRRGRPDVAARFLARADNWRLLVDDGHVKPRAADGSFPAGYDPASLEGFAEGSGAQYTWSVPFDVAGLVEALGGRQAATARLDRFFARLNDGPNSEHAFLGNEPCLHVPWLYAWTGRPDRTAEVVRGALDDLFDDRPGGLPGNDDGGTMSAWWVFAAIGLFPAIPGTDVFVLSPPRFARTVLHVPGGDVVIETVGVADAPYIASVTLDGAPHERTWLRWADLAGGAHLRFELADAPTGWGTAPEAAPPSGAAVLTA